jgi:hypothetical protein
VGVGPRVSSSTSNAVFCTVLGALPLVLDTTGALGSLWPRGTLPAGMSRLALAFLPWFVLFGLPSGRSGLRLDLSPGASQVPPAAGLLLGLPLFVFAGACDHAAGLPLGKLLTAGAAALTMLLLLCAPRPTGGRGENASSQADAKSGYRDLAWFALLVGPVMLALAIGLAHGGAPLSPEQAPGWLAWSPLGWCLLWAAENLDLEPRLALAPFGALAVAVAIRAASLAGVKALAPRPTDRKPGDEA